MNFRYYLLICLLGCFYGCSDNGEEIKQIKKSITVMCSPNGLGDNGYNDLVFSGILSFMNEHEKEVEVRILLPENMEGAQHYYREWYETPFQGASSLFVLAGSEYELLIDETPGLPDGKEVLQFESDRKELPEGVHTFRIQMYGVCYWAANTLALWCETVGNKNFSPVILAAYKDDPSLQHAIRGFKEGFESRMGTENCKVHYLGENSLAYSMPDKAYQLSFSLYKDYDFVFPLIGGSALGLYRYTREYYPAYTAGMDMDCSQLSPSVFFSVEKRVDKFMKSWLTDWLKGVSMKKTQSVGLAEEITDLKISKNYEDIFKKDAEARKAEIFEKELEYERLH